MEPISCPKYYRNSTKKSFLNRQIMKNYFSKRAVSFAYTYYLFLHHYFKWRNIWTSPLLRYFFLFFFFCYKSINWFWYDNMNCINWINKSLEVNLIFSKAKSTLNIINSIRIFEIRLWKIDRNISFRCI